MKTTVPSLRLLILAAVLAALAACEEEKTDDTTTPTPTPLRVEQIIVAPKAAAPLDTVALTADIRSSSPNVGDIPVTKWTADGGTFVSDDLMTVQWVAPAAGGFYTISVRATNAAGSANAERSIFVGGQGTLVASQAGAVRLRNGGPDFYYLRSPTLQDGSSAIGNGVEVFSYSGGVAVDAVPVAGPTGFELVYAPNLQFEVHATNVTAPESLGIASANPRPRQIYVGDLTLGTLQRISQDLSPFDSPRRNQFGFPAVSPDNQLIAYQGIVTNPFTASSDSIDVFVYDRTGPTRVRATLTHPNHKNYFPTFSTDQNWLTFISDRGGNNQWEIYAMPVSGTSVDTNPASVTRLTDTGGTIVATRAGGIPAFPLRAWNPVASTLAIVSADNLLYLMTTSGSGASLVDVTGLPVAISELVWSADGARLAVAATGRNAADEPVAQVYVVTGSAAQRVHEAIPGDQVRDMAFSPDNQWMVFRVARSTEAWLEVKDLAGGTLDATVPLTGAFPAGNAALYRPVMSLSPAWGSDDMLYAPAFTGGNTPAVISVDVSGVQ